MSDLFNQDGQASLRPGTFLPPTLIAGRDGLVKAFGRSEYLRRVAPWVEILRRHMAEHGGTAHQALSGYQHQLRQKKQSLPIGQQVLLQAAAVEIVQPVDVNSAPGKPAAKSSVQQSGDNADG